MAETRQTTLVERATGARMPMRWPRAPVGRHQLATGAITIAGLVVLLDLAVLVFDFGNPEREADIGFITYRLAITAAAIGALVRATLGRPDRLAWAAVGIGILLWGAGDVYWSGLTGDASASYPWLSDVLFLGYYVALLVGVWAFLRPAQSDGLFLGGILVGLIGLATAWSVLIHAPNVFGDVGMDQAAAVAYPLLDVAAGCALLLALSTRGWWADRALAALTAGVFVTALGDLTVVVQIGDGGTDHTALLDAAWGLAMLFFVVAPWLPSSPRRPDPIRSGRVPVYIAVAAMMAAVAVLAWDHFVRIDNATAVLACLTIIAGGIELAALHRRRARAEGDAADAARRSIEALALTVDAKDRTTHDHSDRVANIVEALAGRLGAQGQELDRLRLAGRLHDVGKVSVPDHVLTKPGKLTDSEYELIKSHPAAGARLVRAIAQPEVADWIGHHHERWDGRGYPDGLAGEEIPLASRILGAADALDAMVSDRPYRKAMPIADAIEEFRAGSGTQFDPEVAALVIELLEEDPRSLIGS